MFRIEKLPFKQTSLEPYISSKTLKFHYEKHHKGYLKKLNDAVKGSDLSKLSLEDLILKVANDKHRIAIFNNASQVWNHTFYWNSIKGEGKNEPKPKGRLFKKIEQDFETYEKFFVEFEERAMGQFGSGWAWLVFNKGKEKLEIVATSNADSPIILDKLIPLLVIDVWEHAYYLDYQNDRKKYIKNFLEHLANWNFAEKNFKKVYV